MKRFLKHCPKPPATINETIGTSFCSGEHDTSTRIQKRLCLPLISTCSDAKSSIIDDVEVVSHKNDTEDDEENRNVQEAIDLQSALVEVSRQKRGENGITSEIIKMTSDGSSWIVHIRNYYTPPKNTNQFDEIWNKHPKTRKSLGKLFGRDKECFENRYSQSYGVPFNYSGYKNDAPRPIEEDPVLVELLAEINSVVRQERGPYNGCLVNWYMPEDTIASHSDDERSMKNQSPIFSLSWGGPRRFVVRPRLKTTPSNKYTSCSCADITLRSGDLLVMGGSLQQTHTHEIPKWRKTKDMYVPTRRINWTVRAFHVQQKESAASNS